MVTNRLGLFGGTFDPPHVGHVAALSAAWRSGQFDQLLVTVAGDPYQKSSTQRVASATNRLAMAHAAFDDLDGVEVSDRELVRGGPSRTIDTVRELVDDGWSVELLLGADAAATLDTWFDSDSLASLATVGVFPRQGVVVRLGSRWRFKIFNMDPVDLSSTEIRALSPEAVVKLGVLPAEVVTIFLETSR